MGPRRDFIGENHTFYGRPADFYVRRSAPSDAFIFFLGVAVSDMVGRGVVTELSFFKTARAG